MSERSPEVRSEAATNDFERDMAAASDSPLMDAFRRLLALAATGTEYTYGQVFDDHVLPTHEVIGTGYDLKRELEVRDKNTDAMVPATAEIRILRLTHEQPEGTLFLRTRLKWRTSDGGQYASCARCNLYEIAATFLAMELAKPSTFSFDLEAIDRGELTLTPAQQAVLDEELEELIERQATYEASWEQSFPMDYDGRAELEVLLDYQEATVTAAREANPQLLCQLSPSDFGPLDPQTPLQLLAWAGSQPELAGKL